jgi:hypothetical protein
VVLSGESGVIEVVFFGNEGAEVQVLLIKEVIDESEVEIEFGPGNFGPFDLECQREAVRRLEVSDVISDCAGLFHRAPEGTQNHDRLLVEFKMAAFVAVDVKDLAHE